jgi:transposase
VESTVGVTVTIDAVAQEAAEQRLGWRVYATNAPVAQLTLAEAVTAYREQYQIEHSFGRLKGRSLSLQPMYLARDEHATGLVRLLSLGLRVLSVIEYQVRRGLAGQETALAGLYPGNPTRATTRPTTELLLRSFGQITLTLLPAGDHPQRYLTALTLLQKQILHLLDLPETIYTQIVTRLEDPG